jgi:hypothetical protein
VYIPVTILLFFLTRWTVKAVFRLNPRQRIGFLSLVAILIVAAVIYSQTLETKEQLKAKR